ncbi:MAG: class A beta-lactamase-related serine hydrolase [Pedobacter sp.]|nr:MAG: class A beta-lactamase-related serine hydrolase [Pedobacter sp.]
MAQDFSKVDNILKNYQGNNPGAALAIVKNGNIIYSKSYGLSELETSTPVSLKSNFRLASVSKQFTAAAILQLVERKAFSLSTKLNWFFPALPPYSKEIDILQMLNHTSGIKDYDSSIDEHNEAYQVSDKDVLEECMSFNSTYFKPGSQYKYSNTAYVLLGAIIEKVSGLSYPDYLAKYIFKPVGMDHSLAFVKGQNIVENRAYGYSNRESGWVRMDQSSTSATLGDGGIYSNIHDLLKWDASLFTNKILPKKIWASAFQEQKLSDGENISYGLGWHLKTNSDGSKVVYHTGSTTSFRNIIYRIPSEKTSVILLTNRNTPQEANMVELVERLITALK